MTKLQHLKSEAKKYGLTFKAANAYLNGVQAYALFSRSTGEMVGTLTTISFEFEKLQHENHFSEYAQ